MWHIIRIPANIRRVGMCRDSPPALTTHQTNARSVGKNCWRCSLYLPSCAERAEVRTERGLIFPHGLSDFDKECTALCQGYDYIACSDSFNFVCRMLYVKNESAAMWLFSLWWKRWYRNLIMRESIIVILHYINPLRGKYHFKLWLLADGEASNKQITSVTEY